MKQRHAGRENVYEKQEAGWLREYFAEIFLFILNCILWGYLWFETPLLQSYY